MRLFEDLLNAVRKGASSDDGDLVAALRECPATRFPDLVRAVIRQPDCEDDRHALIDALRGDGDDWADLVDLQLQTARYPAVERDLHRDLLRRQAPILRQYPALHQAVAGTAGVRGVLGMRWGLVEHATLHASTLLDRHEEIFALTPLRSVELAMTCPEQTQALGQQAHLSRLRHLGLSAEPAFGDEEAAGLLGSVHLGRLESLALADLAVVDATLERLAAGGVTALRGLAIGGGRFTVESAAALARSPAMAALAELVVDSPSFDDAVVAALAGSTTIERLDTLKIVHGRVGRALGALAAAPIGVGLRVLALTRSVRDPAVAVDLLGNLARLERLDLDECAIGEPGVRAIRDSAYQARLASLSLCRAGLDDRGALILSGTPLPALRWLALSRNALGDRGAGELGAAAWAPAITRLWLNENPLGPRGVARLVESMSSLVVLDLSGNPIGDDGARALAGCEALSRLELLRAVGCGITPVGARALLDSPHLRRARRIALSSEVGPSIQRELEARRSELDPLLAV